MQLLKITTTPLQYELEVTNARMEYQAGGQPRPSANTTPSQLQIRTQAASLRLDTYEARKSIGFATTGDKIGIAAEKGVEALNRKIQETVQQGAQMAQIEDGVTISGIITQKMQQQPQMYTAFLPSARAEISWVPNNISMNYTPGKTDYNWKLTPAKMNYVRGGVEMKITQYPSVDIEYLGGPLYIPKSADPNYKEPIAE